MPNEVSCPDPDEAVTRKILAEVLDSRFEAFEKTLDKRLDEKLEQKLEEKFQKFTKQLHDELGRLVRGSEEVIRSDLRGALEPHDETLVTVKDHETRLVRLETQPARRTRKPAARRKPR